MQTVTRKGSFDSAHSYLYELTFSFETQEEIGYAIDFKEIKRVACQWIDDILDHGAILNPHDTKCIQVCKDLGTKYWLMSLNGDKEYCNPSAENIAREIFYAMEILMGGRSCGLKMHELKLLETPNCCTICTEDSTVAKERINFKFARLKELTAYRESKGVIEYDERNLNE